VRENHDRKLCKTMCDISHRLSYRLCNRNQGRKDNMTKVSRCYICPRGHNAWVEIEDEREIPFSIAQPRIPGIYEILPWCAKCSYEKTENVIYPGVDGKFPTIQKMSYCLMEFYPSE